jgi:hypothetical protein
MLLDTCQNGGKNKFCDLQTFKELDCFVGKLNANGFKYKTLHRRSKLNENKT